jgi:hypothetical protein
MLSYSSLPGGHLPTSKAELLQGFIVNPDYAPGHDPKVQGEYGKFQLLVNPTSGKSLFVYKTGPPEIVTKMPRDWAVMDPEEVHIVNPEDYGPDGFICLLSEADFPE